MNLTKVILPSLAILALMTSVLRAEEYRGKWLHIEELSG